MYGRRSAALENKAARELLTGRVVTGSGGDREETETWEHTCYNYGEAVDEHIAVESVQMKLK